jgi:hypothetical protein
VSLSHDGYAFESLLHGPVRVGPPELPLDRQQNAGVLGEAHLIGEVQGRDLDCEGTLSGYASNAALQVALDTLHNQAGRLTGTLTSTVLAVAGTFADTTYEGCDLLQGPFRDGSGVNGWCAVVRLRWRQRAAA